MHNRCVRSGKTVKIYLWLTVKSTPPAGIVIASNAPNIIIDYNDICYISDGYGAPIQAIGFSIMGNNISLNTDNAVKLAKGDHLLINTSYISGSAG